MSCSSRSKGAYVANEVAVVRWGRCCRAGAPGVIYLEGSHGTGDDFIGDATGDALANAGFIAVSCDLSQTSTQGTYGNDTAQLRTEQVRTFIQGASSPMQAAAGRVHLFGTSGGATDAINYARANPQNVLSMYLIAPATDLLGLYNSPARLASVGLTQAEMNKAYNSGVDDGGTAFRAAMPTHDPSAPGNQQALAGIPMKLVYSTDDPAVLPSTVFAYADLVNAAGGNAVTASEGAVGHSALGMDRADLTAFFKAHSA